MTSPVIQFKRGDFVNLPPLQAGEPALTLDTFEFYIGINSTTEGNKFFGSHRYWSREDEGRGSGVNLVEGTGGSNYITLASPDTLAGITTYTFPATPEDGFFLKTNADGTLEWASVSAGASFSNAFLDSTVLTGISTFEGQVQITDDTQSDDKDTGSLVLDGGLGVEKNVNLGGDLGVIGSATINSTIDTEGSATTGALVVAGGVGIAKSVYIGTDLTVGDHLFVGGTSEFIGVVTFRGGLINIGDESTDDINVGGEFISSLNPNTDDAHDLGITTQRWRNLNVVNINTTDIQVAGVSTFNGSIEANDGLDVLGDVSISGILTTADLDVTGNTSIGSSSSDALLVNASSTFNSSVVFEGGISGTISTATRSTTVDTTETGTDASFYLTFVSDSSTTESQTVRTDDDISYNPDSNTLTVPNLKTENIKHSSGTQAIAVDASGNVGVSSNLTVTGNLFVNGSTTQVNVESLKVKDSLIDLAKIDDGSGNLVPPTEDTNIDVGLLLNYYTDSAKKAAVYWDDSEARIAIASDVSETNNVLLANAYAALEIGSLWVNDCAGQSQVISCADGIRKLENITIDAGTF